MMLSNAELQKNKDRLSNLDLLRMICSIFVIFLHFCETSAHNAFGFANQSSEIGYILLVFLYGTARIAVPVFMILSGYFSINSNNQKLGKVINLFLMTLFYSLLNYGVDTLLRLIRGTFDFSFLIFIDSVFVNNYYLYLFCGVYALSPFINKGLKSLTEKQYKALLLICIIMFVVWSTIINILEKIFSQLNYSGAYFISMTGTTMGFNIINFILFYMIGGYIKLHYKSKKSDTFLSIILMVVCVVITTIIRLLVPDIADNMFFYDNVFILLQAICAVIIFLNIKLKPNKYLSFIATKAFGIFLVHGFTTRVFEFFISIESVVSKGFLGIIFGILIFVIGVFLVSLLITIVVDFVFSFTNKRWKETKIYNYKFLNNEETVQEKQS